MGQDYPNDAPEQDAQHGAPATSDAAETSADRAEHRAKARENRIKGAKLQASRPDPKQDETARWVAAGGFHAAAWTGAWLLVISFAQFFWANLSGAYPVQWAFGIGIGMALLGAVIFLRSKRVYNEMGVDFRPRSMAIATIVAGSGGVFWLLFFFLLILFYSGVDILPQK